MTTLGASIKYQAHKNNLRSLAPDSIDTIICHTIIKSFISVRCFVPKIQTKFKKVTTDHHRFWSFGADWRRTESVRQSVLELQNFHKPFYRSRRCSKPLGEKQPHFDCWEGFALLLSASLEMNNSDFSLTV